MNTVFRFRGLDEVPAVLSTILILFGTSFIIGCDQSPPNLAGTIPYVASIDTLHQLSGPDATGDDLIAWARPGGSPRLDVGPDGLLWLFNPSSGALQIHDEDGDRISQHGRIGQGPGEFQWLETLTAIEGGAWTWDSDNQQLSYWSAEMGFIESRRTQVPSESGNVIEPDGTLWYLHGRREEMSGDEMPMDLVRYSHDGSEESVFQMIVPGYFTSGAALWSYLPELARSPNDGVLTSIDYEMNIRFDGAGSPTTWALGSLEWPYSERERQPGGRGSLRTADGEMYEAPMMPHKPDVEGIEPVGSDEVWILTPARQDTVLARWERLDVSGEHIGAVWLPREWRMIRAIDENYWVLSWSRDRGYEVLLVHLDIPN
ncbi:hypothetical protein ACFL6T_07070 [Candidatus Zixiibacteriota bacterium]